MAGLEFHLLRPLWLLALLPLGLLLWRLSRSNGDAEAWRGVVDAHLLPRLLTGDSGGGTRWASTLLAVAWLLTVIALAGPTWQRLPEPVYRSGDTRVILLDLSPTMNAEDLKPSRLARARYKVLDMLRESKDGQSALIAYGPEPYVVSPLTDDAQTIAVQVPSLQTDLLPVQGPRRTDLALDKAGELLQQSGARSAEVILVTDQVIRERPAAEAAQRLRDAGYDVSVLGVGTASGAPVHLPDGSLLKDARGEIVVPRLDSQSLATLANAGGGRYVAITADDSDVATLMSTGHNALNEPTESGAEATRWREEGPWVLLLVLPLAALAFRRGWLSPLVLALAIAPWPQAHAVTWDDLWSRPDQQATALLRQDQPARAAETFERPDWRAAAAYQAGDYQQALDDLGSNDSSDGIYNKGNALARLGQLQPAIDAYDRVLKREPENADARHNRDLVQALLDKQQQQQQKQQQDQQQQSDSQNADNAQKSGESSADSKQSQNGKGEQSSGDSASSEQSAKNDAQKGANGEQPSQQNAGEGNEKQQGENEQANGNPDASQSGGGKQDAPQRDAQSMNANAGGQEQNQTGKQAATDQGNEQTGKQAQAEQAKQPGPPQQSAHGDKQPGEPTAGKAQGGAQPSAEDLLADASGHTTGAGVRPGGEAPNENQQAIEQMLRQVEDDPAGLLRQRFILQHLHRQGRLP